MFSELPGGGRQIFCRSIAGVIKKCINLSINC